MSKIKVAFVDDHALIRQALEISLSTMPHIEVVGSAANGNELLNILTQHDVDVVLLDLVMPDISGEELIPLIFTKKPNVKIIILTNLDDPEKVRNTLSLGSTGYLTKDVQREELGEAIRQVFKGKKYLKNNIVDHLVYYSKHKADKTTLPIHLLSKRQQQVFILMGKGFTNQAICDELVISTSTLRGHIMNMTRVLGVKNREELLHTAIKYKLESKKNSPDS